MKRFFFLCCLSLFLSSAQGGDPFGGLKTAFKPLGDAFKKKSKPYNLPDLDNGTDPTQVCVAATQDKAEKSCQSMSLDDALPLYFVCPSLAANNNWGNSKCAAALSKRLDGVLQDLKTKTYPNTSGETRKILDAAGTKDSFCNGWYNHPDPNFKYMYRTFHHSYCQIYTRDELNVLYGSMYDMFKRMLMIPQNITKEGFVKPKVDEAMEKQMN